MEFVIKRTKRRIDVDDATNVIEKVPNIRASPEKLTQCTAPITSSSSPEISATSDVSFSDDSNSEQFDSPSISSVVPIQYLFPKRPGFGHNGKNIRLRANYFEMKVPKGNIYHYDVEITDRGKQKCLSASSKKYSCLNTRINREVIDVLLKTSEVFKEYHAAFDGRKNLYTNRPLPTQEVMKFSISLKENSNLNTYHISVKPVCKQKQKLPSISLEPLHQLYSARNNAISEEAIMALDVILRNSPALLLVPIGRSFFYKPSRDEHISLGGGREIWFGYHQSVRISQWKPMLNIDISATAFYQNESLLKFIEDVLNLDIKGVKYLKDIHIKLLKKELKGIKVQVNHLPYRRGFKVSGITPEAANSVYFKWKRDDKTSDISVANYFLEQYRELRYSNLPCLVVGSATSPKYLPLEVCNIVAGQHCKKKLNEKQISEMIKHTARPPHSRFKSIKEAVKQTCKDNDSLNKAFGITVSHQPIVLDGRVIESPPVMYDQLVAVRPRNGVWDIRGKRLYSSVTVKYWALISLTSSPFCRLEDLEKFSRLFCEGSRQLGINIGNPNYIHTYSALDRCTETIFRRVASKFPKIQLIMVVVPAKGGGNIYAEVKNIAEIRLGLITQCVRDISTSGKKCSGQLIANLCQKVNAKLGGVNNILSPSIKPKIFDEPIMIVGADCTHPCPGERIKSSVAALVGSLDNYPNRYAASVSVQRSKKAKRMEIIKDTKEMMKDLLLAFYRNTNGLKPEKIIFYRDGLSEGEFAKALNIELKLLREACMEINHAELYQPPVTFIVVGKRHHTRFIPENPDDGVGKHKNIPPGTIIDTDVTHPTQFDFYLCSHAGIQGTSRPAHYTVLWDDNKFTADELQTLSFYLCHTYVRCTRSISIPCPVMYAHLAAYRAKQHLISRCEVASNNSETSDSELSGGQSLLDSSFIDSVQINTKIRNEMYFV